jgi:hypothetical protein
MKKVDEFFRKCLSVVKDEFSITGKIQSKIFAFCEDSDGNDALSTVLISEKDMTKPDEAFKKIIETKQVIQEYPSRLRDEGKTPIAFVHVELYITLEEKRISFVKVKVNDDDTMKVIDSKQFKIIDNEMRVKEDGEIVKGSPKMVEV